MYIKTLLLTYLPPTNEILNHPGSFSDTLTPAQFTLIYLKPHSHQRLNMFLKMLFSLATTTLTPTLKYVEILFSLKQV